MFIDAVSGQIHTRDVDTLAQSPCVKAVSIDAVVSASAGPHDVPRTASESDNIVWGTSAEFDNIVWARTSCGARA